MLYEYTQTLKPSMYKYDAAKQFTLTLLSIKSVCSKWKSSIVAELTDQFNIHYHALIEMPDSLEDRKIFSDKQRCFHKEFGRYSFKPVQYVESYKIYMAKDLIRTNEIAKIDPKVRDDFKILEKGKIDKFLPSSATRNGESERSGSVDISEGAGSKEPACKVQRVESSRPKSVPEFRDVLEDVSGEDVIRWLERTKLDSKILSIDYDLIKACAEFEKNIL